MPVSATLRFARLAPRKVRLVARTLKGLPMPVAQARLKVLPQRVAPVLLKLLNSAAANAQHNFGLDPKALVVTRVRVDEGPRLKRTMPRARGMAYRIVKRTSHIEVSLDTPGAAPTALKGKKAEIVTKQAVELKPEDLRAVAAERARETRPGTTEGAVKRSEAPRGGRKLFERKHGGE